MDASIICWLLLAHKHSSTRTHLIIVTVLQIDVAER
jgi:hypothetical protein